MDLTQLRAFVTVAQEGNLTRAAEQLHVSQPAVSLQLKTLQQDLNLVLFKRTPTGMKLTDDGLKLLPQAQKLLSGMQDFKQSAHALQIQPLRLKDKLSIGTILDPEFIRLGAFLKRLVEQQPAIATRLQHHMSGGVLQHVRSGELDVGFYLGEPGKGFHALTLTSFTYSVIAPAGWKQRVVDKNWKQLASLPWIWTPPESAHHRLLSKIFQQYKVNPDKVALVDQEASMLDLVKSGVGLSLARTSIALNQAQAHGLVIANAVSLSTELSFVVLEKRFNESAIAAAFDIVKNLWQ
ncbi:LysR family transcriptional regulator [Herbaspirillum sp. RTI4]|uniref:LysR family transcriptional regulator n=1 Tax=Herbaspirillum sp. RTI4 TaxID=3048640 RepID=UPI002AB3D0B9|nr:LysR family transcriptional regulator [Herbaspirillum sp. RTI4]MDY7577238.1 LysR family transcriptional regulator [Herbaspirillum sp. RTI4]MEA9980528.1 LysR family transcriptional regulator [Herbaspirillum sp. RTI4]